MLGRPRPPCAGGPKQSRSAQGCLIFRDSCAAGGRDIAPDPRPVAPSLTKREAAGTMKKPRWNC